MADTLERLRHRVDVYMKVEGETEFNEVTYNYEKTGTVWAEILPICGKDNTQEGNTEYETVTHTVKVRSGSIKDYRHDMYFMFKGQRYDVKYFMPQYRRNDLIIFYCKLILEGEHDYGQNSESDT